MPKCKLCDTKENLNNSHVIPRFIYRYMLRVTDNKISQFDGRINLWQRSNRQLKRYLFCDACEQLLSRNEKLFSKVFEHVNTAQDRSGLVYADPESEAAKSIDQNGSNGDVSLFLKGSPFHGKVDILRYFAVSYIYRELMINSYAIPEAELSALKDFLLGRSDFNFMLNISVNNSTQSFDMVSTVIVLDGLANWKHFIFYLPNMQFHVAFCVNGTPSRLCNTFIYPANLFDDEIGATKLIVKFQQTAKFAENFKT